MSRTLGVLAGLVLVAGLLGPARATADEAEPDPRAGTPAPGTCYDLTLKQAAEHAAPESPVSCARRHTLVVSAIGEAPASFDWTTADRSQWVDWAHLPRALRRAVIDVCGHATDKLIGKPTRRALTLYDWVWFGPSDAEIAAGARWFSCSVVLVTSKGLAPIPPGQPAKVKKSIPGNVARCVARAKGGYATVACSRAHQWRSTYAKLIHRKPTGKGLLKTARRICPRHTSSDEWLYSGYVYTETSYVLRCDDKTRR